MFPPSQQQYSNASIAIERNEYKKVIKEQENSGGKRRGEEREREREEKKGIINGRLRSFGCSYSSSDIALPFHAFSSIYPYKHISVRVCVCRFLTHTSTREGKKISGGSRGKSRDL